MKDGKEDRGHEEPPKADERITQICGSTDVSKGSDQKNKLWEE